MKKVCLFLLVAMMVGCAKESDQASHQTSYSATAELSVYADSSRFKVERAQVFGDSLAYDRQRGIYVITDNKTGREYVGISGIGIAELGSHPCGKSCIAKDER